jgi:transcription elongation factor GreA
MSTDRPKLSAEARRSLEDRLRNIERERVPRLEREFADSRDPLVLTALEQTKREAARLRDALANATPLEDEPHDPTIVELGDRVTILLEGSAERERFTLVGRLEARLDDSWISEEAPLGAALLGSSVGDLVTVEAPEGPRRYEVLAIQRDTGG